MEDTIEDFEKQMLEALNAPSIPQQAEYISPEVQAIRKQLAEREIACREGQKIRAANKRIMTERAYECTICGETTNYNTARKLAEMRVGTADISFNFVITDNNRFPMIENNDVVFNGDHPCLVCSEDCRKQWIRKYARETRIFKSWRNYDCGIPKSVVIPEDLEALKNDQQDARGATTRKILDAVEPLADSTKGVFLWGAPGNGKTTVASWMAMEYVARELAVHWIGYTQLQQMLNAKPQLYDELNATLLYQGVSVEEFTHRVRHGKPWDAVVIDDVSDDFAKGSQQQQRMKNFFMELYENGTKLVITSNVEPSVLGDSISANVTSRLVQRVTPVHFPEIDFR